MVTLLIVIVTTMVVCSTYGNIEVSQDEEDTMGGSIFFQKNQMIHNFFSEY